MPKILIGNIKGPQGPQGVQGGKGAQGVAGVAGENGTGVAPGGADGQVLRKKSGEDYQTEWTDMYTNAQIDSKISDVNTKINAIGIKETFSKTLTNATTTVTTVNDISDNNVWRVFMSPAETINMTQLEAMGEAIPMITSATSKTITITCKGGTPATGIPVKVYVEKLH